MFNPRIAPSIKGTTVSVGLGHGLVLGLACWLSLIAPAHAQSSSCNQPAPQAITQVDVPGRPFAAIPSADGCTIFVSLTGKKGRSEVAVLTRSNGALAVSHTVAAPSQLTGLALSHDGGILVGANGQGVTLFSTQRLIAGDDKAALGSLGDGAGAGSIYAAFSPDDHLLFVSDERSNTLSVYDFAAIAAGKSAQMIGQIRTGGAPVGLAFSPDGRWLYSTSEVAPGERSCPAEGKGGAHPPGMLMVIDVERSATEPANAVVARMPAGCNPVRVAVSPNGDRVYVTARSSNVLQVFDADKLIHDREHALIASVPVGQSPVGIAVDSVHVFVANSDRFGGGRHQSISILDASHLDAPSGSIPAGGFPRELKATARPCSSPTSNRAAWN
ncbi:MAG TPA: beta-propeller fold lactonase family protein [Burkholderiaceae bacterium]|jgi:DNA-binding beta-propeller fold protein YncE